MHPHQHPTSSHVNKARKLTRDLLLLIARDRADDRVLLAFHTVGDALGVVLRARGGHLGLAVVVLLAAGLRPCGGAGEVADGLDEGALDGVVLAGVLVGLAAGEDEGQQG